MNKELKELISKIYDEKISKLQKAKVKFLESDVYYLISPQEIFSAFCRENPQIPAGELLEAYKKKYATRNG